jgi:hypothetical protein
MTLRVQKRENSIDRDTRATISNRYHEITKAVNREFRSSTSDTMYSLYVGSYGRGTAIDTSDIDILLELPESEYKRYDMARGNGQSRLIQAVKNAVLTHYPSTNIHGDGQVVVVTFSDGMKIELLPAFKNQNYWGTVSYTYPDANMGGNWKSTNPKAEQDAMRQKNATSNGLLFDTCKQIRYVRDNYNSSYHLSGIVIDTFVYDNIGSWRWLNEGEEHSHNPETYEESLLKRFNNITLNGNIAPNWHAPGSGMTVNTTNSIETLHKVLKKMSGD